MESDGHRELLFSNLRGQVRVNLTWFNFGGLQTHRIKCCWKSDKKFVFQMWGPTGRCEVLFTFFRSQVGKWYFKILGTRWRRLTAWSCCFHPARVQACQLDRFQLWILANPPSTHRFRGFGTHKLGVRRRGFLKHASVGLMLQGHLTGFFI